MTTQEFYTAIYRRIAQVSVGPSSLRKQGAPKVIHTCRKYFESQINLKTLIDVIRNKKGFIKFLNEHTLVLKNNLPDGAQNWGTARKGLNLFIRDVMYNKFVSDYYNLPSDLQSFNILLDPLEIPLDNDVVTELINRNTIQLPEWNGIKYLIKRESDLFQEQASLIAKEKNIPRIHLDLEYYRQPPLTVT
jgi:hypothetical protein